MRQRVWIANPNQKHYRNVVEHGTAFITTTILDFAPIFADPRCADAMAASLLSDCRYYQAYLRAFVVMPTHIHLLLDLPENKNISELMNRIKRNSSRRIMPMLSDSQRKLLAAQSGLNTSVLWKASFRSVQIRTDKEQSVKADYIHWNPVKKGLCTSPEDYRWSSASLLSVARFDNLTGLIIDDALIAYYS